MAKTSSPHPALRRARTLLNTTFRKASLVQRAAILEAADWLITIIDRATVRMTLCQRRRYAQITNRRLAATDTLITVGGDPGMREALARGTITSIVSRAIRRVPRIASVCSGTFFLAAAGALDGRRASHALERG